MLNRLRSEQLFKMSKSERKENLRKLMLEAVQGVLDESADICNACVVIYNVLQACEAYCKEISEEDFLSLKAMWSDLEEFPKDEKRLKYSPEELLVLDDEEKKAVDFYKDDLKDICRKILASDIPNMGPPEDPYAWPSDEQLKIWNNNKK